MDKPERATGGPIEAGSVPIIGEDGCSLALPAASNTTCESGCGTPVNITINVHGSVVCEEDLARIVRDEVRRWNRRGGNGLATA